MNTRARSRSASAGRNRERGLPARYKSRLARRDNWIVDQAAHHRFASTRVPVLCEIEAGIQQVSRPDAYRKNLTRLLRQISVWPIDPTTARIYGEIHRDLKRRGRVLSQVDMMLAALAKQMGLTLATSDQDFAAMADIATENWISP